MACYARTRQDKAGEPWGAVGNSNNDLTTVSMALLNAEAYDPLTLQSFPLAVPMSTLGAIAETGPTHHLIGHPKGAEPIGAFKWTPLVELGVEPAQRSMWAAEAKAQKRIITEPTHGGEIVDAELAKRMVTHRSTWFIKRDMRWTSQPTAIGHTRREVHGGRAWAALEKVPTEAIKATALFHNSIFGGIIRNNYGSTQQTGRAILQVGSIPGLPCPAFHADTPEAQHARNIARQQFDELASMELEPFAYLFRDKNRQKIDHVVAEMLGLDPAEPAIQEMLEHYRLLFASEPNVNGRQKSIVAALAEFRSGKS